MPNHFRMIETARRRFAPTGLGITRNSDRHQIGIGDRHRRNTQQANFEAKLLTKLDDSSTLVEIPANYYDRFNQRKWRAAGLRRRLRRAFPALMHPEGSSCSSRS